MSSIPQFFPGLPDYPAITALRDFRQWVAWAWKKKPDGSFTKPPINPHTGFGASHSNPLQWGSYDEALARAQRDHLAGIGFVLEPAAFSIAAAKRLPLLSSFGRGSLASRLTVTTSILASSISP